MKNINVNETQMKKWLGLISSGLMDIVLPVEFYFTKDIESEPGKQDSL